MISIELKDRWREVNAAVAFRKPRIKASDEIQKAFATSNFYGNDDSADDLLNQPYTTVTSVVPRLTGDELRANVTTMLPGSQGKIATEYHWFANSWVEQTNFIDLCVKFDTDILFGDAVAHITLEKRPGPEWRRRPKVERVPRGSFFYDPRAMERADREFEGHEFIRSKKELTSEDGWDVEAISRIPNDQETEDHEPQQSTKPERDYIVVRRMWVPRYKLPDAKPGCHGTVFTMAGTNKDGAFEDIRPPEAWYGPEGGPYEVEGITYVPDEPNFLAPLVATHHETKIDNQFESKLVQRAKDRKHIAVGDAHSRRDVEAIKTSKDGDYVLVRGTDKAKVVPLELGAGVTDQDLAIRAINAERRNSHTGITESLQGNVQKGPTARAELIGLQGANTRLQFMQWKSLRFKGRILRKVCEWAWKDERIIEPLGMKAAAALKNEDPIFQGGHGVTPRERFQKLKEFIEVSKFKGVEVKEKDFEEWVGDFDMLQLEVDAMSTERRTPENARAQISYVMSLVPQFVQGMAQYPDAIGWEELANQVGMAFHCPWFPAIVNPKGAAVDNAVLAQQGGGATKGTASQGSQKPPSDMLQEGVSGTPNQGQGAMQGMAMSGAY